MARKSTLALTVIALAVLAACSTGTSDTATSTSEAARSTTEAIASDPDEALEVTAGFFDAFNSGDLAATLAFFDASTAEITGKYFGPELFLSFEGDQGQLWMAYLVAADALKSDETCAVSDTSETEVTIECSYMSRYSTREAVGAPPLETTATIVVGEGLILAFEEDVMATGPNVGNGYTSWLATTYPEDAELTSSSFEWASIEEAVATGEAEAAHVTEYAAYLEENGCEMTGC